MSTALPNSDPLNSDPLNSDPLNQTPDGHRDDRAASRVAPARSQQAAIKALAALAHDGRLTLMRRLIQAGPDGLRAGELARFAKVGATTASAQLQVLANADLVRSHRDGRFVTYTAAYDAMGQLLGWLMQDCCGSRQEICADLLACCA